MISVSVNVTIRVQESVLSEPSSPVISVIFDIKSGLRNKLYKLCWFMNLLNENFMTVYAPDGHSTLDDALMCISSCTGVTVICRKFVLAHFSALLYALFSFFVHWSWHLCKLVFTSVICILFRCAWKECSCASRLRKGSRGGDQKVADQRQRAQWRARPQEEAGCVSARTIATTIRSRIDRTVTSVTII